MRSPKGSDRWDDIIGWLYAVLVGAVGLFIAFRILLAIGQT